MIKVYITGASGFVGSNLVEYLKNIEIEVTPINVRSDFDESKFKDADVVVHLAGKAHDVKNALSPQEYYEVNTKLTCKIYNAFLNSTAKKFIFISSVKAVADTVDSLLKEDHLPDPQTHYGKSKLLAEKYIQETPLPSEKSFYILRPCMIHGPGNKGNLNLLFKLAQKGIPWPLGKFKNLRSFLSIENLCFTIAEIIKRDEIPYGIYQVSDDTPISTNELIIIINEVLGYKSRIWYLPKWCIISAAALGNIFSLPLNSEKLKKLTESYIISNEKLVGALKKPLPVNSREGIIKTIRSFVYG